MKVIEIIEDRMRQHGYTGLVSENRDCGCELDDLAPCGWDFSRCELGYKHFDPRGGNPQTWAVFLQKEPPTEEQWERMPIP